MRPLVVLVLLSSSVVWGQATPPATVATSTDRSALDRFLARADEPLTSYCARRRLEARNERLDLVGWMEVRTELVNPATLLWSVIAEGGSGAIRSKVLRKALEGEAETLKTDPARSALTAANYTFTPSPAAADAAHRILIDPRRQDRLLLRGSMLVSDLDGDLLAVEGRLAKNPSFWTSSVDVTRRYARIQGVRVPIEMISRARVKLVGTSSFRMTWDYESVNGVPVSDLFTRNQAPSTTRTPR